MPNLYICEKKRDGSCDYETEDDCAHCIPHEDMGNCMERSYCPNLGLHVKCVKQPRPKSGKS